eukprot:3638376-Alexandrium_andersonii.AAC.1
MDSRWPSTASPRGYQLLWNPMVNTTASPKNPFPAWRASDRFQFLSMFSLERRLQKVETAAGARHAQT